MISRRVVLAAGALLLPDVADAQDAAFAALENQSGGRIGAAALDTASGKRLVWRADEHFVMCSTFKLSLAAAILARCDAGRERLDRVVHYENMPLLEVSPATSRNQATGMTIADLCRAAVIYSDNTAANLLLAALGGPGEVTRFWRGLGDSVSRLDDIEPKLNVPAGVRNTATPNAMLGNLHKVLIGNVLSPASRARLLQWMHDNTTGGAMLRAGLPADWQVGDKTGRWNGTDPRSYATNDLAIVTPPGRKPVLVVCYTKGGPADADARPAVVAAVGRIVAERFA
jgi:beta-lactamase class A